MTAFGPSVAQSVAGNAQALRLAQRANTKPTNQRLGPRKRIEDEVDVELIQGPEAVRKLKDDDEPQENLREQHHSDDPRPSKDDEDAPATPHIDLEG